MDLNTIIQSARGETPVDLLLTNARIVNVFSGEIISGHIAVTSGYIVGIGAYPAKNIIDLGDRFVAPGFIDAHVHIESSMMCITEFARAVTPLGTTTVVADPHEIANVLGIEGIEYMLRSSENQPLNIYFTLPSCVPATAMETSGAQLSADHLAPLISHPNILALAEMMNYPGVIHGNREVLDKIETAKAHRKRVDGHAPGLTGPDLFAYIASGVSSDHECTTAQEAQEKLRAGMHIMIREGTGAQNLKDLLPAVNDRTSRRMMWCTDDRHPHDLLEKGHIDGMIREALRQGLNPVMAIQMATINPAEYFGIHHVGAVAPGRFADLVVFSNLDTLFIEQVYLKGILVAEKGKLLPQIEKSISLPVPLSVTVNTEQVHFSIPASAKHIRVIEVIPGQILTRQCIREASISKRLAIADTSRDLLKIAVIERHTGSGNMGIGFVKGFGFKQGAIASSVAHDSHNIIVVGTTDEDMRVAVNAIVKMGGGLSAACDKKIVADLALPIAGLMSYDPIHDVRNRLDKLLDVTKAFGTPLLDPFMTLSFLALPVIPELKITDKGLVDVLQFKIVPLFLD
ncbi:MAG: adenine deaminase [Desulfobacterales bacterium]|nr:MAG: adenine deaminase [Desulfobacterales bacterium]